MVPLKSPQRRSAAECHERECNLFTGMSPQMHFLHINITRSDEAKTLLFIRYLL